MMQGSVWKHTKSRGYYAVVALAIREADGEAMVVYRSLDDNRVWVRPLAEWHQVVPVDETGRCAPRFQMVGEAEKL